jgi:adenosylhomocysteine nucleosidase
VKKILPDLMIMKSPFGEFADVTLDTRPVTLFHGGWGKISAAATAQYCIDHFRPDLLVNLGTCGGFEGRITAGTVMLVERTIVYDIIEQMSDAAGAIAHYSTEIDLSWLKDDRPWTMDGRRSVVRGLLVSADRDIVIEDIPMLIEKYGAVAADWESGAIAWVAERNGVRCLILRGVSDLVGAGGGEAYGSIEIFRERTQAVMAALIRQLPDWLAAVK